jgi:hypothetical protein
MAKRKISESRARMIRSGIAYLRFKGYHEIKADITNFNAPQFVYTKTGDSGFQPDVIAQRNFGTFIFDVVEETDLETWAQCEEKWQAYEAYAIRKKGKLGLIVYGEHADDIKKRLAETLLDPSIIRIKSQE